MRGAGFAQLFTEGLEIGALCIQFLGEFARVRLAAKRRRLLARHKRTGAHGAQLTPRAVKSKQQPMVFMRQYIDAVQSDAVKNLEFADFTQRNRFIGEGRLPIAAAFARAEEMCIGHNHEFLAEAQPCGQVTVSKCQNRFAQLFLKPVSHFRGQTLGLGK